MAPPTHGWPSAVSTEPCAYSCSPKWCRWCVVCVTRHRQVSPRALYRSHCVFSSSSSFRAFAAAAASSAARPTGRADNRNPFASVADWARAMVSTHPPRARAPSRRSRYGFTAARARRGGVRTRHRGRAAPPMPSTRKSIVSGDSVPDAAGGTPRGRRWREPRPSRRPRARSSRRSDSTGAQVCVPRRALPRGVDAAGMRRESRAVGWSSSDEQRRARTLDSARGCQAGAYRSHHGHARGTHRPSRRGAPCNVRGVPTICSCAELDRWRYPETGLVELVNCEIVDRRSHV